MALHGLWGSYFSHKGGHALAKMPKCFWSRVLVDIAAPQEGVSVSRENLHHQVANLLAERNKIVM